MQVKGLSNKNRFARSANRGNGAWWGDLSRRMSSCLI